MTEGPATQGNSTSSVLGRRLGAELMRLRTAAGMNQTQAGKVLSASTAKVAKMERGWVPIRDPDIRALCEQYAVSDPGTVGALLELARVDRERRKAKGWWNNFPGLGDMHEYVSLENAATAIRVWQLSYVPGLLQTRHYAQALTVDNSVREHEDNGRQFVAARLARQQRLTDDPPLKLWAVIHEAALRHLVGSAEVMRDQVEHLTHVTRQPNVTVQVLPFSAGAHLGMGGAFNIISFGAPGAMDVVYTETALGQLWVEGGEGAAQHDFLFDRVTRSALDVEASQEFLEALCKE